VVAQRAFAALVRFAVGLGLGSLALGLEAGELGLDPLDALLAAGVVALGLVGFAVTRATATATTSEEAGGPARRKGPRTPPWAFSHGKRPESAGKSGRRPDTRYR
jgi:hypothetical protein